ncbi:hypothetical protein GH714_041319 [Hevea brasiliensis]|uniref:Protein arginine N-methyltransferase domain-containing protein n=1 Tax=Hevea brasiliensis TaxID=3981 RepID=A0A6A6N0M7_HEVBR|nr:hypothetical protein GH714_041319 [Hevea brasiliensis]
MEIDCSTASVNDVLESNFLSSITMENTRLCGFGGWFDVHLRGRRDDPAKQEIELTTAPSIDNATHWGQPVFLLHPPVRMNEGDYLNAFFMIIRSKGKS